MDNSTQMDRILDGMLNFNAETRGILDSVKTKIDKFLNQHYHINENPIVLKTLEQEYEDILATNEEYQNFSAIGYRATLQNGDTVMVTGNSGQFFLNGEPMIANYTYTGDGCEIISVWVFESSHGAPELNDTPTFDIQELNIKTVVNIPVVSNGYKNYATTIKTINFSTNGIATKKLVSNGSKTFNQTVAPATIQEVESDCTVFDNSTTSALYGKTNLIKATFPSLTTITNTVGGRFGFLNGCTNKALIIDFPNLISVYGANDNAVNAPFYKVYSVTLPKTVTYVGKQVFNDTSVIILNCNKAQFVPEWNWCVTTPTVNFQMCEDWQTSINITVAAKNHTIDWFAPRIDEKTGQLKTPITLLDKLHDFSGTEEIKSIVVPSNIFILLTDEEVKAFNDKGWEITGG